MLHVKRSFKRKKGSMGNNFNAFKWIKPEDSEHLTKIPKHDKRTSLFKGYFKHVSRFHVQTLICFFVVSFTGLCSRSFIMIYTSALCIKNTTCVYLNRGSQDIINYDRKYFQV